MVDPAVARETFVKPALTALGLYSFDAEKLLMGTAAVESNFVNFVQFGGGPARGMFQMEAATFDDMVGRVLAHAGNRAIRDAAFAMATNDPPPFEEMTHNHLFAAAMARIKYYSVAPPIPDTNADRAAYWRHWYNGESPHGLKVEDYLGRWQQYCVPIYPDEPLP